MSSVGASKSDCVQFAEGIAKAYVRAIAQKPDEYAQLNFQCTTDDFPNTALSGRAVKLQRNKGGHTQAIGGRCQNLPGTVSSRRAKFRKTKGGHTQSTRNFHKDTRDMIDDLNREASRFMTASITVGREFSNAMYKVLCSALKEFDHSQNNVSFEGEEVFYQAFRTEMNKSREETRPDGGTQRVQPGVVETLGANPELGKIKGDDGFLEKVKEANPKNTAGTHFKIEEGGQIQSPNQEKSQDIVRLDPGFIEAAQKQAFRGDIVIMCGVNRDSLDDKGVLARPDRYAPKPMTCHAKSSYFGFTKGLVPVNQKFSRRNIAVNEEEKKKADKDVEYSKEHGGQEYPLEVSVEGDATNLCPVYQGEFSQGEIRYRFQVAVPAEVCSKSEGDIKNWVQEAINGGNVKPKLDPKFFECGQDSIGNVGNGKQDDGKQKQCDKEWKMVDLENLSKVQGVETINIENFECTLVLGPQKNSGKGPEKESEESASVTGENNTKISSNIVNKNTDKKRYYVSDYDVFAIAHTHEGAQKDPAIEEPSNEVLSSLRKGEISNSYELLGKSGGEVADPADVATINAINAQLLGYGENLDLYVKEYQNKDLYNTIRTFQPIQHAAAATLHFNNPAANPTYPLFAIEENHVIAIRDHKALAAYLYCLENPRINDPSSDEIPKTCFINSALSNILARELVQLS